MVLLPLCFSLTAAAQEQRTIEVQVKGAQGDTLYLANYVGNKLFYADTAVADAQGMAVFAREKGYRAGVYALVAPGPEYFEFIVNEPVIELTTSKSDLKGDLKVVRSVENERFIAYIRYLDEQRQRLDQVRGERERTMDPIKKSALEERLRELNEEVLAYQKDLVEKDPSSLVSRIVRMSLAVELETPRTVTGEVDSVAAYYQYRDHFWDNTDLTDPVNTRVPVFANKLEEYITKVIPQVPDTINHYTDRLIAQLGDDPDLYRYVVHFVTYTYETSDIMGMDAVFVHMAKNYYCPKVDGSPKAFWLKDEQLKKVCERADKMAPLVIGSLAAPLVLPDTTEERWISSHDLPQEYVVLCFWDPHCGHCKKELPILNEVYHQRLKGMDVEVYAVAKATDSLLFNDWRDLIVEHKLDWVNVGLTWHVFDEAKRDPRRFIPALTTIESLNYAETYDVYSTPKVFVLDGDRRIVGKQLSPDQIADLIERLRAKGSTPGG